jgi:hypothetical protein
MRPMLTAILSVVCVAVVLVGKQGIAQDTIKTRIGDLSFTHDFANGYPTDATVKKLHDEIDFQRACQVYIWALPIVSMAQVTVHTPDRREGAG